MARRKRRGTKGLCGTGICWESIQLQVDAGNNHLRHPGRVPTQCEFFLEQAGQDFDAANRNIESQACDRAVLHTIHGWTNIARLSDCQAAARGVRGLGRRGLRQIHPRSYEWLEKEAEEACAALPPGKERDKCKDYYLIFLHPQVRKAYEEHPSDIRPVRVGPRPKRGRYGRPFRRSR